MAQAKRGFTLTELLVVIAIVALLAALASVGVMTAMNSARATAIKVELDQIDAALKRYKDTYGSYPPCNLAFDESGLTPQQKAQRLGAIRQHLAMAFPRYSANETKLRATLTSAGIDLENFRPDQALVFWLQGFGSDPTSPILSVAGYPLDANGLPSGTIPQKRTNNFFEFDVTRLVGVQTGSVTNPAPSYFPPNARFTVNNVATKQYPEYTGGSPPIVYFDYRFYEFAPAVVGGSEAQPNTFNGGVSPIFADAGVVSPYWYDANKNESTNQQADADSQETWVNPDSFQLIAAGGDSKYSSPATQPFDAHLYPTGKRFDLNTESDNAVNFTSKSRLGDDLL